MKPKLPFKVICTNCNKEVEFVHKDFNKDIFADKDIEVSGSAFYDSAIVYMECKCGNEIEL